MELLPQIRENRPSPLARAGVYLFVPIGILLLLPVLFLIIIALYLLAIFHGVRMSMKLIVGKPETLEFEFQKPHFLDMQVPAKALPDVKDSSAP